VKKSISLRTDGVLLSEIRRENNVKRHVSYLRALSYACLVGGAGPALGAPADPAGQTWFQGTLSQSGPAIGQCPAGYPNPATYFPATFYTAASGKAGGLLYVLSTYNNGNTIKVRLPALPLVSPGTTTGSMDYYVIQYGSGVTTIMPGSAQINAYYGDANTFSLNVILTLPVTGGTCVLNYDFTAVRSGKE
jgi:hypothetical protein